MERPAEILAEIARRILIPGVTGAPLEIGRPFGGRRASLAASAVDQDVHDEGNEAARALLPEGADAALGEIRALLPSGHMDESEEAVMRRLRRLVPADSIAIGPRFEPGVIRLAALLHDAVAAFHPDMVGLFRPNAPKKLLDATLRALSEVPPPSTLRAALLRHAWLGELVRCELVRTEVKWWTGRATFIGKPCPPRLLAWPEARRVQRKDRSIDLLRLPDLFADKGDVAALGELYLRAIGAFLVATPITDLVLAARAAPSFVWRESLVGFLASRAGARVARRAIALGEDGGKHAFEAIAAAAGGIPSSLRAHPS